MKRSRFFLGAAALVLAAASAFAATNAHRANQYYYISGSTCQPAPLVDFACNTGGNGCTFDVDPGSGINIQQLYLVKPVSGVCQQPLQPEP